MPLYKQASKEMLQEHNEIFSMFANFLGAEIQQKTAVASSKDNSGLQMIAPNYNQSCG